MMKKLEPRTVGLKPSKSEHMDSVVKFLLPALIYVQMFKICGESEIVHCFQIL